MAKRFSPEFKQQAIDYALSNPHEPIPRFNCILWNSTQINRFLQIHTNLSAMKTLK